MKLENCNSDFGRVVAYYPSLKKITGSTTATILLCQLLYWSEKSKYKPWVYKTSEEIEEETGLSYYEQKTARKLLTDLNLVEEHFMRLDRTNRYKLNIEELTKRAKDAGIKEIEIKKEKTPKGKKEKEASPLVEEELEEEKTPELTEEEKKRLEALKIEEESILEGIRTHAVKYTGEPLTKTTSGKKGDFVDGTLDAQNYPGMKMQRIKNEIKETIEHRLNVNATGRRWEGFIKFAYTRQEKFGEPVSRFIDWAVANGFDPIYWTPEKLETLYPQAFSVSERNKPVKDFVQKLPEHEDESYDPMPKHIGRKRDLF